MFYSAITQCFDGKTSVQALYVGNTKVWPINIEYDLVDVSGSALEENDVFVMVAPNNKKIVGESGGYTNLSFTGFTGSGTYSSLPTNTVMFRYTSTGCSIKKMDGGTVMSDFIQLQMYQSIAKLSNSGTYGVCLDTKYLYSIPPSTYVQSGYCYLCYDTDYGYPALENGVVTGEKYQAYKVIFKNRTN